MVVRADCGIDSHQLWSWVDQSAPELDEHISDCDQCRPIALRLRRQIEALAKDSSNQSKVPSTIGPYALMGVIGRGGMGIVYRAVQPGTERHVAVKALWDALDGQSRFEHYFEREVRALGRMDHPNIARVYESGRTERGQRYLAMELVEGIAIDKFVQSHNLSRHKLLQVFEKICDAIAHAHLQGVLHRDIKPSNILLTEDLDVRIVDFGLARLTEPQGLNEHSMTVSQNLMGTLPYISPERLQNQSQKATYQSDVYALGVLLYELLTGHLPFPCHHSHKQTLEAICRGDYARPKSLDQSISQDLNTIVETALETDCANRYASVADLRDDVTRYLTDRPIHARSQGVLYRTAKAVRRNRVAFAIAACVFAILLGSSITSTTMYLQAREQAHNASVISAYLESVFATANPEQSGRGVSIREMLDNAADRLDVELADQPTARAVQHRTLGFTYGGLGAYRNAETHLRAAIDIRRLHYGESSIEVAESLCDLGEFANMRYNPNMAQPLFEEALAIHNDHASEHHAELARCLRGLGVVDFTQGTFSYHRGSKADRYHQDYYSEAEAKLQEAISLLEANDLEIPSTYFMDLGMVLQRQGELDESERAFLNGIEAAQRTHGENSISEHYVRFEYAQLLEARCEFEEAEQMFRESLTWQRNLLGGEHPYRALSLSRFADFLCNKLEAFDEAEALYTEALKIRSGYQDGEQFRTSAIKYRRKLSVLHSKAGDPSRAIEVLQGRIERALEKPSFHQVEHLVLGGEAHIAGGDFESAEDYFREVLSLNETLSLRSASVNQLLLSRTFQGQAKVHAAHHNLSDAESDARQALRLLRAVLGDDDLRLADSLFVLGEILAAQSKYLEAEMLLGKCLEIRRGVLPNRHSLVTAAHDLHARCVSAL